MPGLRVKSLAKGFQVFDFTEGPGSAQVQPELNLDLVTTEEMMNETDKERKRRDQPTPSWPLPEGYQDKSHTTVPVPGHTALARQFTE